MTDAVLRGCRKPTTSSRRRCSLAGEAFERSIGLKFEGSRGPRSDLAKCDELLASVCSGAALDEAAKVVEEAAIALVESERFQTLAFALAPVLAKERYVGAKQIRRILEEADPERETHSLERHDAWPPQGAWWQVSIGRKIVYRGVSQVEAYEVQARHPGSLVVGSTF